MKEIYIGIDLGTTNSVIGYSIEKDEKIITQVLDIDIYDENKGKIRDKLIHSCVHIDEKNTPIVGKYAKKMLTIIPDTVVKSVKNYMGQHKIFKINNNIYTPEDISSFILKHLLLNIKRNFDNIPRDIVVTIPASFDSDMRNATLNAAKKAGIENCILLSEPQAALYDYINLQKNNEILTKIDFSKEKFCMVYDLGGGTLDVSVHKVFYNGNDLKVEDLGISRYTNIGGDSFDRAISVHLLQKYLNLNKKNYNDLTNLHKNFLQIKLLEYAEEIKIALNSQIDNKEMLGINYNENDIYYELLKSNIIENDFLIEEMNLIKYKKIVNSLLAEELSLNNVKDIDNITDTENIIFPILDALSKAETKLGKKIDIDFVLLNGGMSKFKLISQRINKLFPNKVFSTLNQDLSVARGASIYNYLVKHGYKTTKILNETIGLQRNDNLVEHLIQAGTVLPCRKVIDKFAICNDGTTFVDLPFYVGRKKDTNFPNRKLTEKRIKFNKPLSQGDKVILDININEDGIIDIKGIVENKDTFNLNLDTNKIETPPVKIKNKNLQLNFENKENIKKEKDSNLDYSEKSDNKIKLEITPTLKKYYHSLEFYEKAKTILSKKTTIKNIKEIEKSIKYAENNYQFVNFLLEDLPNKSSFTRQRIVFLLGEISSVDNRYSKKIGEEFMTIISIENLMKMHKRLDDIVKFVIEAFRKMKYYDAEEYLYKMLNFPNCKTLKNTIIMTLAVITTNEKNIYLLQEHFENEVSFKISYFWAIGKLADNGFSYILFEKELKRIEKEILKETHYDVVKNMLFAVIEIKLKYKHNSKVNKLLENFKYIISQIKLHHIQLEVYKNIATKVLNEIELEETEYKELLAIRSYI
ncbi:MAG: dnaK2 [Fusobacteriales bacterium]|jgi:molecular chaperone DnaK (HSP70)|nr:dnaK2 [Fusobacteriales bacterium]